MRSSLPERFCVPKHSRTSICRWLRSGIFIGLIIRLGSNITQYYVSGKLRGGVRAGSEGVAKHRTTRRWDRRRRAEGKGQRAGSKEEKQTPNVQRRTPNAELQRKTEDPPTPRLRRGKQQTDLPADSQLPTGPAVTAVVTVSHSAVRRAKSWTTPERSRLIAVARPPGS